MFFEEKRKVDLSGRSKKQDRSATLLKAQREREADALRITLVERGGRDVSSRWLPLPV